MQTTRPYPATCVLCPSCSVHQSEEHRLGGYDHSCKSFSETPLKILTNLVTADDQKRHPLSIINPCLRVCVPCVNKCKQESIYPTLICSSGPASATHPSGTALISTGSLCNHGAQIYTMQDPVYGQPPFGWFSCLYREFKGWTWGVIKSWNLGHLRRA